MNALALYDTMVNAIAECARVDEVKDIRDKAAALEAYYRQARNLEAEREAANVRLRAERRVGELLKDLARAPGQRSDLVTASDEVASPYADALATNGMTRQSAHRYQALANIPKDEFDAALAGPEKASTNGVLARTKLHEAGRPPPRVSDVALWLGGRLRDFERDGYFDAEPAQLFHDMTDAMRADVLRLAPLVARFLNSLEEIHEPA